MSPNHPRRRFIGGVTATLATAATIKWATRSAYSQTYQMPRFAYVGSYTSEERNAHGTGINVYRIDPNTKNWLHIQNVNLINPSFLAADKTNRFLYSVHADQDYASAFKIDAESGQIQLINQQTTGGTNGVHLAVDQSNRYLVISNYASGSIASLPIASDGSLLPLIDLFELEGSTGPKLEQEGSHPHHNPFDPEGRFFVVPDKGFDTVFVFRVNPNNGSLIPAEIPSVPSRPGAAPRHASFHPVLPYLYVINELDSTMAVFEYNSGTGGLNEIQLLSTLPRGFMDYNTTAEVSVHPSGRFLYGSNRGHNSIVGYSINQMNGMLSPIGWTSSGGERPRYFGIDPSGTLLFSCNQDTHTIVAFAIDQNTGALTPTGMFVETGSPVTIVFI
ncbi:MAG: 6-phosphogluconolactonase [Rhodospirillaceae bacterium]|nr:6-phosphogluconolactonase [Rhodospirillaceae bacterium]|tara:strand:+ start:1152 stop:2318 length:1167 start_codon:yes stop_codon:yes gene_type:complete